MTRSIVEQAHDFYDAVPYEVPVPETSLYELLDTAARLYPDRVALDYFGATTTYAQVRDQVLRAARVLHEAGVRAGRDRGALRRWQKSWARKPFGIFASCSYDCGGTMRQF